jgi:hypothetical protein
MTDLLQSVIHFFKCILRFNFQMLFYTHSSYDSFLWSYLLTYGAEPFLYNYLTA